MDFVMMGRGAGQRFSQVRFRPGYKIEDVDAFIDRVEAVLLGEAPAGSLTADDVKKIQFRTSRLGGYDEEEVDRALDVLEAQLRRGSAA